MRPKLPGSGYLEEIILEPTALDLSLFPFCHIVFNVYFLKCSVVSSELLILPLTIHEGNYTPLLANNDLENYLCHPYRYYFNTTFDGNSPTHD